MKDKKKILTMTKKGSPHTIVFAPDKDDPFFFDVRIVRKATGEIRASHYILKSDMPRWISMYEGDLFTIVETNNE